MSQGVIRGLMIHSPINVKANYYFLKCETIMKKYKVSKRDYNTVEGDEDQTVRA